MADTGGRRQGRPEMTFVGYLRWDGWLALAVGAGLLVLDMTQGHQTAADAVIGGFILVAGTGVFLALRHWVPFREPGAWFTRPALSTVRPALPTYPPRRLWLRLAAGWVVSTAVMLGFSVLTGYWLTYGDFAVWALIIGAIKLGPGVTAVARRQRRAGVTYRVARRPLLRGVVRLTSD